MLRTTFCSFHQKTLGKAKDGRTDVCTILADRQSKQTFGRTQPSYCSVQRVYEWMSEKPPLFLALQLEMRDPGEEPNRGKLNLQTFGFNLFTFSPMNLFISWLILVTMLRLLLWTGRPVVVVHWWWWWWCAGWLWG